MPKGKKETKVVFITNTPRRMHDQFLSIVGKHRGAQVTRGLWQAVVDGKLKITESMTIEQSGKAS